MEVDNGRGGADAPTLLTLLRMPHALARILGYAFTPQQLHDDVGPVCRRLYDFVHTCKGEEAELMYGRLTLMYGGRADCRDLWFMRKLQPTLRRLLLSVRTNDVGDAPPLASLFAGCEWRALTELELAGCAGGRPNDIPAATLTALIGATPALRTFRASNCDLAGEWVPPATPPSDRMARWDFQGSGRFKDERPHFTLTDGWPALRTLELRRCHLDLVHCVVLQTRRVQRAHFSLWPHCRDRPYMGHVADGFESDRPAFVEFVDRSSGTLTYINMDWRVVRRSDGSYNPSDLDALGRCLLLAQFRLAAGSIYDRTEQFDASQCLLVLAGLPRLEKVQLRCQSVPDGAESRLADCRLPSVTELDLQPWSMSGGFARTVVQMFPSLCRVHMANVDRLDDALLGAIVRTLPMLTRLRMSLATLDHASNWLCLGSVPNDELRHIEHIDLRTASTESEHGSEGQLRAALLAVAGRGVADVRFRAERLSDCIEATD